MQRSSLSSKWSSMVVCATVALLCAGCPWWHFAGGSALDPALIGTWRLVSSTSDGVTTTCPGSNPDTGFSCSENETLTLKSDGNFTETLSSTVDDEGIWFAVDGLMMLDDEVTPDNSGAFTYVIEGTTLTARTLSGGLAVVYERVGAASTVTEAQIVLAHPELSAAHLVDPALLGTWVYISIQFQDTLVPCPGTSDIPGISCGENETVTFKPDNTFSETVANTDHSEGVWYAMNDILLFDDTTFEDHDPTSWTYTIHDDVLTLRTFSGVLISTLRRVQD